MKSQTYFKTHDPYLGKSKSKVLISLNGSSGVSIGEFKQDESSKAESVFTLLYPTGFMGGQFFLTNEIEKALNERFKL